MPATTRSLTDDLGYELRIARTGTLPPSGDVEPNDDATTATPVSGAFELSGDVGGSADAFRWMLSGADAARSWRLEAVTSIGTALNMALTTADGEPLAATDAAADGFAAIHDLRLSAGDYVVRLSGSLDQVQPYTLRAVEVTDPDIDPEPNDPVARAIRLDPAALMARGRLAAEGDVDRYLLDVDATLAALRLDITLTWSDGSYRTFCLSTEAGTAMGCPTGEGSATLPDLVLPEGRYRLDVSGTPSLDDRYELRVVPGAAAAADHEAEPNDAADTATRWDPTIVMHGSASGVDVDTYRVHVDAPPALWRLDAAGTGIQSLSWLRPDLTPMGSAEISQTGARPTSRTSTSSGATISSPSRRRATTSWCSPSRARQLTAPNESRTTTRATRRRCPWARPAADGCPRPVTGTFTASASRLPRTSC